MRFLNFEGTEIFPRKTLLTSFAFSTSHSPGFNYWSHITETESTVIVTSCMEAGSNTSTVAQRIVGGDENGTQCPEL
jgi:hypothetical protein